MQRKFTDVPPQALYGFAEYLTERAVNYREEPFQLRAGGKSNWYLDVRMPLGLVQASLFVGELIVAKAEVLGIEWDVMAASGIGGKPPMFGARWASRSRIAEINDNDKERTLADDNYPYGLHPPISSGDRVLVIDDTLASGDSVITSIKMSRGIRKNIDDDGEFSNEGERGVVEHAFVVVDRSNGVGSEAIAAYGVEVHALFEFSEETGLITPIGL